MKINLSVLKIFPLKFILNIVCIRASARRWVPSCHLFHGHVHLIQCSKYQPGRSAVSPDIHTQSLFEYRLYPENRSTGYPVVPPLAWTCSSDTMFQISARRICCFSWYTHLYFFRKSSVSGDHLDGGYRRALSNMGMFSWYKILMFRKINISVLQIFPLKFFSKIVCIKRTARPGIPSFHLLHGHVLLIQCSNNQPDRSAVSPDIPTQNFFENRLYQQNRSTVIPSCHLFHGHVLLIQCSNYQPDRSSVFPDITTQSFFENHLYQENRSTGCPGVPPFPWTCSSDTMFEISARSAISPDIPTQNFFEICLYQKIIWTEGLVVPSLPWACSPDTRFLIFRKINLPLIKIFQLNIFWRIFSIRRTA